MDLLRLTLWVRRRSLNLSLNTDQSVRPQPLRDICFRRESAESYYLSDVLQANGIVAGSSAGKRKATDEPKQEPMSDDEVEDEDEEDEDTKVARIKVLEVFLCVLP